MGRAIPIYTFSEVVNPKDGVGSDGLVYFRRSYIFPMVSHISDGLAYFRWSYIFPRYSQNTLNFFNGSFISEFNCD